MKDKLKTQPKCDMAVSQNEEVLAQLKHAQRTAMDDIANALESIIHQQKLTKAVRAPRWGNVRDAKQEVIEAMVSLAIAASDDGLNGAKAILSDYGLDHVI